MAIQDIPASVGYLTVTAEGIAAIADSIDVGDNPDSHPMMGTVGLVPALSTPLIAIAETPATFIWITSVKAEFDADGVLRPPKDGIAPPIDPSGDLRIIAPDQPAALSQFGWTWKATFKPGDGQKWRQFTVDFGGSVSDTINLADEYAAQTAASAGAFSPMIHRVSGPFDPETDPLPEGIKPGMYVLDESSGDTYLVADDSTVGFFANIAGEQGEPGNSIASVARTSGDGTAGTTDTYTITYTDATTSTFQVTNGDKGDKGDDSTVPGPPGVVQAIVAGDNITIDDADPANPKVNAESGSQWDDVPGGGLAYTGGGIFLDDSGAPATPGQSPKLELYGSNTFKGYIYSSNSGLVLGASGGGIKFDNPVSLSGVDFGNRRGSASSPLITVTGNMGGRPKSGIYFTDNAYETGVAISTAGVERLKVDKAGDVAIAGNVTAPNLTPSYYRDGADYVLLGTNTAAQGTSGERVKYLAGFAYFWLIKPVEDISIIGLKCGYIQVPGAAGAKFRIWLYETDASVPVGEPLLDSGDMDGTAMAYRSATFPAVSLKANKYYAAAIITNDADLSFRGVSEATSHAGNGPWLSLGAHSAPSVQALSLRGSSTYGPAPATPPSVATDTAAPPLIYWTVKR